MARQSDRRQAAVFWGLWLFIVLVSSVDGYLVLRHRREILKDELNPIGRILIAWNRGGVWYLLTAKFVGTVLACATLLLLFDKRASLALIVATVLATLQFCLLLFLFVA